jgi:hypothetical protein
VYLSAIVSITPYNIAGYLISGARVVQRIEMCISITYFNEKRSNHHKSI